MKKEEVDVDQVRLEVEAQVKRFETAISNIAFLAQRDIVNPFCDRNKLKFVMGSMGTYGFFTPGDQQVHHAWEGRLTKYFGVTDVAPEGYDKVFDVLNIEVSTATALFNYMEDYDGS